MIREYLDNEKFILIEHFVRPKIFHFFGQQENVKNEHFLVEEITRLTVTEEDMKREHKKQLEKRQLAAANRASNNRN
jgi:hypothetical protein